MEGNIELLGRLIWLKIGSYGPPLPPSDNPIFHQTHLIEIVNFQMLINSFT